MGLKQETENRCLCVWGTAAACNMCGFAWVLRFLYHRVEEEGGCESLNVVSALTTAQKSRIRIRMIPWAKHHGVTWRPGDPEICAVSILHLTMQGRDKKVKVCWVPLALLDHIASSHWLAVLGTHPVTGDLGRVLLRTRSISSHHGTSQSSAVMSRVWGGGTGVVVPEN